MAVQYIKRLGRSCDLRSSSIDREERIAYTVGIIAQQLANGLDICGF